VRIFLRLGISQGRVEGTQENAQMSEAKLITAYAVGRLCIQVGIFKVVTVQANRSHQLNIWEMNMLRLSSCAIFPLSFLLLTIITRHCFSEMSKIVDT
jgi:uncharacterized membrane protein HdeD (DUF308 family)